MAVNVNTLFKINPDKFIDTAKGKTYEEFCEYLKSTGTFGIIDFMSEKEKRELYELSISSEK